MDKINKAVNYIKENLNVIILIPTLLGGFWQLLELATLDISFIRFFSLTQVLSDGMVVLLFVLISLFFYYLLFSLNGKKTIIQDSEDKTDRKRAIYFLIFYILICGSVIIVFSLKENISKLDFALIIYITLYLIKFIFDIIVVILGKKNDYNAFISMLIIVLPLFIYNIGSFFKEFHKMYLPSDFKNIKYIECYMEMKKNEIELLYFNDKYIFVKINKTKEIEIINFEEMLKKDNCKIKEKGN